MREKDFPSNEFEEYMIESAKAFNHRTIVYVDGEDIRLAHALKLFKKYNKCKTVMLGEKDKILGNLNEAGIGDKDGIEVIEPKKSPRFEEYTGLLTKIFSVRKKSYLKKLPGRWLQNPIIMLRSC